MSVSPYCLYLKIRTDHLSQLCIIRLNSVSFFMICFKKRYKCRPERNKNKFPICLMMMTAFKSTIGHPSSTYLNVNVFWFSLNSDTQAWFAQDF